MAYVFVFGGFEALVLAQAAVLAMPLAGILLGRASLDLRNITLAVAVAVAILLGLLFNLGNYPAGEVSAQFALLHAAGLIGMLLALQWAATNLDAEKIVGRLAVFLFPLIAFGVAVSLLSGGTILRQSPLGIHPNWWGELAFAFTACSLALRKRWRVLFIATAVALMVLVESRGALLASVVSVGAYTALSVRHIRLTRARFAAVLALCLVVLSVFAYRQDWLVSAFEFGRDDVLLLNDKYRGVGTGLTGRLDGWREAVDVFSGNLLLGSGLDTLEDVHNGFLRVAGENGLVLLVVMLGAIALALHDQRRNYLALSILLGYIAYAMTYPRMLNMNAASAIFYLSLFRWSRPCYPKYRNTSWSRRRHKSYDRRSSGSSPPRRCLSGSSQ
jgi:hypothetical protein